MDFQTPSRFATITAFAFLSTAADAALGNPTPSSYVVTHRLEVNATPAATYAALGDIARWWSPDHTYSGKAENLRIELRAGACFCESWATGSVEHARVIYADRDKVLRLEGGIGPLQEKAVTAILTFAITPVQGKTQVLMTYRVRGVEGNLDATANLVDKVLGEQLARLVGYIEKK